MTSRSLRLRVLCIPIAALALCVLAPSYSVFAQDQEAKPEPKVVAADPADVESIDAITKAVYASISGGIGVPRQWDRFRSLFIKDARLIPVQITPNGNSYQAFGIEDYISRADGWFLQNGFFETETHRKTEQYGSIAHHFSTYDSRRTAEDPEPFSRGINSFQLMHDGTRWWIVTIFWQGETPAVPIPAEYLPTK